MILKIGGSNYGAGLDLVAPGVLIPTTDRVGAAGYNPNIPIHNLVGGNLRANDYADTDYTAWFNGTSSAAPQVAGVAALILSVNPGLTQQQVRNIIESTADKVGNYSYTMNAGEQAGVSWNNEMGYGRLNALAAVQAALPTISGPSLVCTTNSIFNLSTLPPGATVSWTRSSNLSLVSSNNASATVQAVNSSVSGSGWVRATINGTCGSFDVQEDFWVGISDKTFEGISFYPQFVPVYDANSPIEICLGETVRVLAQDLTGGIPSDNEQTTIEWDVTLGGEIVTLGDTWTEVKFCNFYSNSSIKLRYKNACGGGGWMSVPVVQGNSLNCDGLITCNPSGGGGGGGGDDGGGGDGDLPQDPVDPCDCGDQFICECLNNYEISTSQNPVGNSFDFKIKQINESSASGEKSATTHMVKIAIHDNERKLLFEGDLDFVRVNEFNYNSVKLPRGIYFINFLSNDEQVQFRVIKR